MPVEYTPKEQEKMLGRAYRLLTSNGIHGYSMDRLAKDLGVSKKTIYKYFTNKEELVLRVIDEFDRHLSSVQLTSIQSIEDVMIKTGEIMTQELFIATTISDGFVKDLATVYPAIHQRYISILDRVHLEFVEWFKTGCESGITLEVDYDLVLYELEMALQGIVARTPAEELRVKLQGLYQLLLLKVLTNDYRHLAFESSSFDFLKYTLAKWNSLQQ
jgi:AcrR family transcriptional regulator